MDPLGKKNQQLMQPMKVTDQPTNESSRKLKSVTFALSNQQVSGREINKMSGPGGKITNEKQDYLPADGTAVKVDQVGKKVIQSNSEHSDFGAKRKELADVTFGEFGKDPEEGKKPYAKTAEGTRHAAARLGGASSQGISEGIRVAKKESRDINKEFAAFNNQLADENPQLLELFTRVSGLHFLGSLGLDSSVKVTGPTLVHEGVTRLQAAKRFETLSIDNPKAPHFSAKTCPKSYLREGEFSGDTVFFRQYPNGVMASAVTDAAGNKKKSYNAANTGTQKFMVAIEGELKKGVSSGKEIQLALQKAIHAMHSACIEDDAECTLNFTLAIPDTKTKDYLVISLNIGDACCYDLKANGVVDHFPEPPTKSYSDSGGALGMKISPEKGADSSETESNKNFAKKEATRLADGIRVAVRRMRPGEMIIQGSDGLSDNLSPETLKSPGFDKSKATQEEFTAVVTANLAAHLGPVENRTSETVAGSLMQFMRAQPYNVVAGPDRVAAEAEAKKYPNMNAIPGKPDDFTVSVITLPPI